MTCPRCNYEWDVSKNPCPRCGLLVRLPGRLGARPPLASGEAMPGGPHSPDVAHPPKSAFNATPPIAPQTRFGQQSGRIPSLNNQEKNRPSSNPLPPLTPYPQRPALNEKRADEIAREANERSQAAFSGKQDKADAAPFLKPMPDMPRSTTPPAQHSPDNPFLARLQRDDMLYEKPMPATRNTPTPESELAPPRNVPQRPQGQPPVPRLTRSTENLAPEVQRPVRSSRLVTDALHKESKQPVPPTPLLPTDLATTPSSRRNTPQFELPPLTSGTLLRGGRYRLRELQGRQEWLEGIVETTWAAQDAQRSGSQVTISELTTPESRSMTMQSMLRNATMGLTSIGRHAHIPTLWDAFSDQGRSFFVFEPTEGESIAARMHHTGRALPEENVIECCLQIAEVLEILAQQSPPMVHGLITPEHILIGRAKAEYVLTNFSIVLASGATQYITGIDRSFLSVYASPEFARGAIDGRADLYSLLATAYHAVTGSMPTISDGSIPQAQRLNPTVSPAFDAILSRGLHTTQTERYQRLSELRQDLLAINSVNGSVVVRSSTPAPLEPPNPERTTPRQVARSPLPKQTGDTLSQILPSMLASGIQQDEQEQKLLLPRPEDLESMPQQNDARQAMFWLMGILLCLIVIVIVSRGIA